MNRLLCLAAIIATLSCEEASEPEEPQTPVNNDLTPAPVVPIPHTEEPNALPEVTNVSLSKSDDVYTINYDLSDSDNEALHIKLLARNIDTNEYEDQSLHSEGDIGETVPIGNGKTLIWTPTGNESFSKLQLVASDQFVLTMEEILSQVSLSRVADDIQKLQGIRHHQTGQDLLQQTRDYIVDQFEQCGLIVNQHSFNWGSTVGENILGQLSGQDEDDGRYLVVGHYDTTNSTPGADDNLSGTVGMLEVMRVLSQYRFNKSLSFIGFDLEEHGLIGSKRYVAELARFLDIAGVINFEMIGYPCRTEECADFPQADTSIYNIAVPASGELQASFSQSAANHVPRLKVTNVVADGDPNFRRSDHAPFWDAGIPALFLTDGANFRNPHYHQSSDVFGTLDINFTTDIIRATIATLAELAELNRETVVYIDISP